MFETRKETLTKMESEIDELMPDLLMAAEAEEPEIDIDFIETQVLKPKSEIVEKLFSLHCKEQAL